MLLDHDHCYAISSAKDARYDGHFFIGVKTTGIYCRPICPARTPKSGNVIFYPSAAAAQEAGFRPCLRCRPETAPDTPAWKGTSATIGRALRLIEEGGLDENGVVHLAMRLGIGDRQLRRLFLKHLGATPIAVAQTRRVLLAKQLLHETSLPMSQVALASGFASIRRFNEVFQRLFDRPPAEIRRSLSVEQPHLVGGTIDLKLRFRAPYDWDRVLQFLSDRRLEHVEAISNGIYSRTFCIGGEIGVVRVGYSGRDWLNVSIQAGNLSVLPKVISAIRHAFDLGADTQAISSSLSSHRDMSRLVASITGLRKPCSWDGFEGVMRAVLGQQITVKAAIALGGQLVEELGQVVDLSDGLGVKLTRLFPTPEAVGHSDLSFLRMPAARRETLIRVAQAFVDTPDMLTGSFDDVCKNLLAIKGLGPWTVNYIALRVSGDNDAFPSGDVALVKAYNQLTGCSVTASQLDEISQNWRPWRAYAAQYLWSSL
jgi:AraC family transcriptional regulator, regulatory protein of adaptative response / DNA-3-methyladenine glycosylase II